MLCLCVLQCLVGILKEPQPEGILALVGTCIVLYDVLHLYVHTLSSNAVSS